MITNENQLEQKRTAKNHVVFENMTIDFGVNPNGIQERCNSS